MDDQAREDELANRQGGRLYPVGRALRATFDAENHDTLGSDVAGLMINLSHIDPPVPSAAPPIAAARASSLFERMGSLFGKPRG